jgi:hypothetical protein
MKDITDVYDVFRILAPEFKDIEDENVKQWILLTSAMISRKRFGHLFSQALALLTAHRMKMAKGNLVADGDPLADIGNIGMGNFMRVGSFSEGQVSIGFNHDTSQYADADADYTLTEYGIQYLTIRHKRIMPIVSAAEPLGR